MISSGLTVMDMRSAQHFLQGRECCASLPQWLLHRGRTIGALSRLQRALSEINLERADIQNDTVVKSLMIAMEFEVSNFSMSSNTEGELTCFLHLITKTLGLTK